MAIRVRVHAREGIVDHGFAEVIQGQVGDSCMVAWEVANLLRFHHVIEHPVVRCGHQFDSIVNEVAIKFHQESYQSQMMRRDVILQFRVVGVSERWVVGWLEPSVDAIDTNQSLVLIALVKLL